MREVLKLAFPNAKLPNIGYNQFYRKSRCSDTWTSDGNGGLICQSVKDFLSNENINISDVCKSIIDLIKNKVYTEPGVFQAVVRDELMDADKKQSVIDFLKKEDVNDFHIITKKTTTTIHVKY